MNRVLIVRLGAMGDIVHAVPVAAALRSAMPEARIDWLVSVKHRALLDFVPIVDRPIALADRRDGSVPHRRDRSTALLSVIRTLRSSRYDVALDVQGLIKSAVLARASGAPRVIGFAADHLREPAARFFYTERCDPPGAVHVMEKNLGLLSPLGIPRTEPRFPFSVPESAVVAAARDTLGVRSDERFAIVNPGGGWPNKRWAPDRFGAVAARVWRDHGLRSLVLWGPGERPIAEAVVSHGDGTAVVAPPTSIGDVLALLKSASLMISGDSGPLHLAAVLGTPVVGIYGPTSPARNGPWSSSDVTISRFERCDCHHKRRCLRDTSCLGDISVEEVASAVDRRVEGLRRA
jgi:lipopolysaccharide heptosyltransferase I